MEGWKGRALYSNYDTHFHYEFGTCKSSWDGVNWLYLARADGQWTLSRSRAIPKSALSAKIRESQNEIEEPELATDEALGGRGTEIKARRLQSRPQPRSGCEQRDPGPTIRRWTRWCISACTRRCPGGKVTKPANASVE